LTVKYKAVHRVVLGVTLTCVAPPPTLFAAPAPTVSVSAEPAGINAVIAALASSDPVKRDQATAKIIEMGADARRAVYEASRGDDPELRARASALLLRLPWYLPDDSPAVRQLLTPYGQLDADKRKEIVYELGRRGGHAFEALARLIVQEPNDDVKWAVVTVVRVTYDKASLELFRKLEVDPENAPLLAAMGHAWLTEDVPRGEKLLRKAVAVDFDRPSNDGGEVEFAYDRLQNLALLDARYDEVGNLLRLRARRGATDGEGNPSPAVLELFAAHGKFGPLSGFEKDLETYHDQLDDPRIMFALGKVYERCGQNMLAEAMYRSAYLANLVSIANRFDEGDFLLRQGWLDLAEGEFKTIFDLATNHSDERDDMTPETNEANAHFRLSQVAAARGDHFSAAKNMEEALQLHRQARGQLRGATDQSLEQEIAWHYLLAAKEKGDTIEVQHRLDELATQVPTNPDIANDVVPMLRQWGRDKAANEMFENVYKALEQDADTRTGHPMPRNNMAWLCARCGERKGEALVMAQMATKAMPDNAAFVDTLAEAHFQLGHYEEAAKLEARVVNARPGDRFLRKQLKRFQDAAGKEKSRQ
jgi:tetratricopeptide (TPR) repeat protein